MIFLCWLYQLPPQVSRLVRENLTNRALRFNLVLDDVSITHVAFSPEFTHAVEAKQVRAYQVISLWKPVSSSIFKVAQQTALRAAFLVDQAIQEKQVRFIYIYHITLLTMPSPLSQLSSRHRVKLKVQNWLERPCVPTKVSLSFVGWKRLVISPIFWRHLEIGSCLIPRACFWTVRAYVTR